MNFQQIMIRLGVDGTAIRSGLGAVGSQVRAWGASIAHGFRSYAGGIMKGFLVAEAVTKVFEYLGRIKERILLISRLSKETGANTNFIQSIMNEAERVGVPFEKLTMGIAKFNKMLGAAKSGNLAALKTLSDMGVVTSLTNARSLNFTDSVHNLAVAFSKLRDKQQQAYLLQRAFGKSYMEFTPIFERGVAAVDAMSGGSFFTKINSESIDTFQTTWRAIKSGTQATMATVVNAIGIIPNAWAKAWRVIGIASTGRFSNKEIRAGLKEIDEEEQRSTAEKQIQAMADKEGVTAMEMKNKIIEEQNQLLEKQADLSAVILDRDKLSVQEMASKARQLTGMKGPLENMHTVTPRMRTALKVETLEERAKVAFLRGDDKGSARFQGEADQIRKSNTWLKRSDVNPMLKTESELSRVNLQLEPVKRMAELVTSSK